MNPRLQARSKVQRELAMLHTKNEELMEKVRMLHEDKDVLNSRLENEMQRNQELERVVLDMRKKVLVLVVVFFFLLASSSLSLDQCGGTADTTPHPHPLILAAIRGVQQRATAGLLHGAAQAKGGASGSRAGLAQVAAHRCLLFFLSFPLSCFSSPLLLLLFSL